MNNEVKLINNTLAGNINRAVLIIFTVIMALHIACGKLSAVESVLDSAKIKEELKKSEAAYFKNKKILDEILDRSNDDISFIKKAFKILLKKEPSDSELTKFVSLVGSGTSRLSIIDELTSSDEYFLKNEITGFVKTNSARLMQSPGFESTSVMRIKKDDKFKILSRQDEWYSVILDSGSRGYIRSENITINAAELDYSGERGYGAGISGEDMQYLADDRLQDFRQVYSADIDSLKDSFQKLKSSLVMGDKYKPYEIKAGKLIEGEKNLTIFRSKTQDLSKKIDLYNSKNPIKHRIAVINVGYKDVLDYKFAEKLIELQSSAINAVAVEVLKDGRSMVPTSVFACGDEARDKIVLNDIKQECDYRSIKKYALVDVLNFGKTYFDNKKEYFMKNAFGEYSNAIEKDRYFVDFTNPEVDGLIRKYLEDIIKSGYFDAVIIDNLKMPYYPSAANDIRALFIFNDGPVREFEKNTGVSVSVLSEAHEAIFKKFAISKFENFVSMLRKFFASKKVPFYAICDADYYSRKFDTRLCEFKQWGNNIDMLFLRFNESDEKKIEKVSREIGSQIARPQVICVSRKLFADGKTAFNFSDVLKKVNMTSNLVRGLLLEE
ncbi:MAG: hypothetical protein BWY32_01035 [bacterium ADurb.Bin243]|nr:MAG: hypothetical protein BWY32_01035 [bacterium ADurb.Bin243]